MNATDKLKDFLDLLPTDHAKRSNFYVDCVNGKVNLQGIVNKKTISIAVMIIEKEGLYSNWHKHDSMETFILKEGASYIIEVEGVGELTVTKTNSVYIPNNVAHRMVTTH